MKEIINHLIPWINGGWSGPYKINLLLTDNCNLQCKSCWRASLVNKFDSSEYEVSDKRLIDLVNEGKEMGVKLWQLSGGGEPLVRKNLCLAIMEKIKSSGMEGELTTNGTLFTKEDIKLLVEINWDKIIISLDGPDAETNDFLRPPAGTFAKISEVLHYFSYFKKLLLTELPYIIIHCVISKANFEKIVDMVKFASSQGVNGISFNLIRKENQFCGNLLIDTEEEIQSIINQLAIAKNIVYDSKLWNNLDTLINFCLKKTKVFNYQKKIRTSDNIIEGDKIKWLKVYCYQPWYYMLIEVKGNVSICCLLPPFPDNIKDKSLKEIWLGENFMNFRKDLLNNKTLCNECNATLSADSEIIRGFLSKEFTKEMDTYISKRRGKHNLNICFLSREYPPDTGWGGIGTYTYQLARGLVREGYQVHVICQSLDRDKEYVDNGVFVHRISHKTIFPFKGRFREFGLRWEYSLSVYRKLIEIIDKYNIDIVEAPNLSGEGFIYSFHKRTPLVTRLHTHYSEVINFLNWDRTVDRRLSCWFENIAILRSDLITCSTRAHLELVAREVGIRTEKIKIIPLGVPIPQLNIHYKENSNPIVLFVGRLEKRKGVHTLIQSVPYVLEEIPKAQFIIVGRDTFVNDKEISFWGQKEYSYKEYLINILPWEYRENVKFLGYVSQDELDRYYRVCDIFVAPSLYESFGLIYIEAMSYAKPVIGCGVGGVPEVIKDGVNGILVPPQEPQRLAEAIIRLLKEKRYAQKIGNSAREYVEKFFSIDKMVENTLSAYFEVCKK
ncbi:MAG: glycosyltransferase [Candidatus Omnitrophica bacterium]|nr:glycosyltransferase [Candidatus Omnitrophota bacterium]